MTKLAISKFKATCLGVLEKVRRTGRPVLITKRGIAIAQVTPPPVAKRPTKTAFGCMRGTAKEVGDVLEPLREKDWNALR